MIPTYLERVLKGCSDVLMELDTECRFVTESGDRYKKTYYPVIDDAGHFDLKEKGVVDTYAEIQSHADSVDINRIIARLADGDVSVLEKHKGFFADVSEIPNNYAAFLQIKSDAELVFADLPVEIREQFNFDPGEFIASFGTEKFYNIFKSESAADEVVDNIVKESVADVEKSE